MTANRLNRRFMVNQVTVDPLKNLITSADSSSEVSPRAIEILQLLVEKGGEIVTYQEIEEKIWKGYNSHTSLYQQIASLRKALGDDSGTPKFIKTVSRRGYQFIGELTLLNEAPVAAPEMSTTPVSPAVASTTPIKARAINMPWLWGGVGAAIVLVVAFLILRGFIGDTAAHKNAQYAALTDAVNHIGIPHSIVAIEVHQDDKNVENLSTLNTIAFIAKHHLERKKEQHVIFIPTFDSRKSYEQLVKHFLNYGKLQYIFRPVVEVKNNEFVYGLDLVSLADGSLTQYLRLVAKRNVASDLPNFERSLLEKFKHQELVDLEQSPMLSSKEDANQFFIDAMDISLDRFNPENVLDASIENLKRSMNSGQDNLIAYSALWDIGFLLMNQQTRYNVDPALVLMKEKSDIAQRKSPAYFKSYYASAEYYCRIQDYNRCASVLEDALNLKSFDAGTLGNLRFLLERIGESQTEATRINYYLNPFTLHAVSFYRNALLSEQRFGEATRLVNYHRKWEFNLNDWYLVAQTQTRIEDLVDVGKWYLEHPLVDSNAGDSRYRNTPSRYMGYLLLNANKPELAKHWSTSGREENLPYFDVKIINLLADLWQGQWDSNKWKSAVDYANDRKEFQNTLDKIYIAYFYFVNGQQTLAGEYLEKIFPQFIDSTLEVTRDNFRYVVYYNETKKRIGDHRRSLYIEHELRKFIETLPPLPDRDVDFGIADIEFYAMNNEKEKAMTLLRAAIVEQQWLPNAFWLWVPIERNPFLTSLYDEPEFKELSGVIAKRLSTLCFEKACANKVQ